MRILIFVFIFAFILTSIVMPIGWFIISGSFPPLDWIRDSMLFGLLITGALIAIVLFANHITREKK